MAAASDALGTGSVLALLLLGDGRLPTGGHVHSGGVEQAVAAGRVHDEETLRAFALGRLSTVGRTDAALAAATGARLASASSATWAASLRELDGEAHARVTATSLRVASRRLGRQLLRVAGPAWPHPVMAVAGAVGGVAASGGGLHAPVALGTVAFAAGVDVRGTAALAAHATVAVPTQAAVRLLGLDPFAVAAVAAGLSAEAARVVDEAVAAAAGPVLDLPAGAGPALELDAVAHAGRDDTLFAT